MCDHLPDFITLSSLLYFSLYAVPTQFYYIHRFSQSLDTSWGTMKRVWPRPVSCKLIYFLFSRVKWSLLDFGMWILRFCSVKSYLANMYRDTNPQTTPVDECRVTVFVKCHCLSILDWWYLILYDRLEAVLWVTGLLHRGRCRTSLGGEQKTMSWLNKGISFGQNIGFMGYIIGNKVYKRDKIN